MNKKNFWIINVSDYSRVVGYKVNTKRSTVLLYTNINQVEFVIENMILFILSLQKWNTKV